MGPESCNQADADVHMKKYKNKNGELYCRYSLVLVFDFLSIGEDADGPIKTMEMFSD